MTRQLVLMVAAVAVTSTTQVQAQSLSLSRGGVSVTLANDGQMLAGSARHRDDLSYLLYQQANAICWEMYTRYQHAPEFRETYREMYKILQDARHIHDLVHPAAHARIPEPARHIAADLCEMDDLFHHVEDDIALWPTVYSRHYHYHSYHRTGGLRVKMAAFSETLHHLMEDYNVQCQGVQEAPAPGAGASPPPPTVPSPGIQRLPQVPTSGPAARFPKRRATLQFVIGGR